MKIGKVEIYQLDKWNWTYRLYTKNTSHLAKSEYSWKESKQYFGNSSKAIEWVRQVLVDDVLDCATDLTEAKKGLAELSQIIDTIVNVEKGQ